MVLKVFFSLVKMFLFGLVVCDVCIVSFFRLLLVGSRLMLVLIRLMQFFSVVIFLVLCIWNLQLLFRVRLCMVVIIGISEYLIVWLVCWKLCIMFLNCLILLVCSRLSVLVRFVLVEKGFFCCQIIRFLKFFLVCLIVFCRLLSMWLDMVFILVLKLIMVMLLLLCYMCMLLFLNMVLFGLKVLFSSGFGKC